MIDKPLLDLLSKEGMFAFGEKQQVAFKHLIAALVSAIVLRLYNPKELTEVYTDASKHGYGAVLLQKDSEDEHFHPTQNMNRKTKSAEERYHSYESEVLVIETLKKCRVYQLSL